MERSDRYEEAWARRKNLQPQRRIEEAPISSLTVKLADWTLTLGAVLLFLLCATLPSRATTLIYKDFDTLVAEATGIVEGTVTDIEAVEAGRAIYSFVTLSNLTLHKGRYDRPRFTLMQRGGRVGRRGHSVAGAPTFAKGDRVIVFVSRNGRAWVPFVGWEQGVFRVQSLPGSRERLVTDAAGNRVLGIDGATVVKEMRVRPQAEILRRARPTGASGPVRRVESPPPESARIDASGSGNLRLAEDEPTGADRPPMRYEAFVAAIRQRGHRIGPGRAAADAEPLTSATRSDALSSRPLRPQPFRLGNGPPAAGPDEN